MDEEKSIKTKSVNGKAYPMSSFAYVGNPDNVETWALPIKDENGNYDLGHVAAAAAALSPGGFRGNRVSIPDSEVGAVKRKLVNAYKRLGRRSADIPKHLTESKSLSEEADQEQTVIEPASTPETNPIQSGLDISEIEIKGQRGLKVRGHLSSLHRDFYDDQVAPTPQLVASTKRYVETLPASVMIQHANEYKGRTAVKDVVGIIMDHGWDDNGLWIEDFIPQPSVNSNPNVIRAYNEIKAGEFHSFSPGGRFYRDTGVHQPPGIIVDWDLFEHSLCYNPVDPDARIDNISEIKSIVEAANSVAAGDDLVSISLNPESEPVTVNNGGSTPAATGDNPRNNNVAVSEPKQATSPKIAASPAAEVSMENDNVALTTEQQLEALQKRLAEVESRELAAKEAEQKALRENAAREEAEKIAREAAIKQQRDEDEQKALVAKFTAEAMDRYRVRQGGGAMVAAGNNTGFAGQQVSHSGGAKYSMAGPVVEQKSRLDAQGNQLPALIVDWIKQAKAGQIRARYVEGQEQKAVLSGVPGAVTTAPSGASGGFALPAEYLDTIVPLLVDQFSIRSLVQVLPANSILIEVPRMATRPVRAQVVLEGNTKPTQTFGTDYLAIRMYTNAMIIDIANQTLHFSPATAEAMLRDQLVNAIRLAEFYYVLQGSGTNEPVGIITALLAADTATPSAHYVVHFGSGTNPLGATVTNAEKLPDFIARAINTLQLRFYNPTALLVNPSIWWALITTKDSQGRYLVDQTLSGQVNSVWGLEVRSTTQIPLGTGVLADWSKLRLYVGQDVTVDMSSEAGTRWDRNVTGFRIEEMLGCDANQEINAFELLDFTTNGISAS